MHLLVPSAKFLWNDKIDTLDNAVSHMSDFLESAVTTIDGRVVLDKKNIPDNLDSSLKDGLNMLAFSMNNATLAEAIILQANFLKAFQLALAAKDNFKGNHLAGIKVAWLP